MANSPARLEPFAVSERELQMVAARRQTEDALIVHTLRSHYDKEAARVDAETTFEASKAALDTELEILDWGVKKAQAMGSTAAAKLVADRVEQLSRINSVNLARRFGS